MLSRCIVIDNLTDLRNCIRTFLNPLVIVTTSDCSEAVGLAINKGHHVFVCVDASVIDIARILRLSRPKRSAVAATLQELGLSPANAQQLARDFGRSIPVLRRHLAVSGAARRPPWSEADQARSLMPLMLLGSISESTDGDKQIAEIVSGFSFTVYAERLNELRVFEDSPVVKIGEVWTLKSPLDSWFLIAGQLTADILTAFSSASTQALEELHPKYELSPDERWMAAFHSKIRQYSPHLRMGLAETLVRMSVFGDKAPIALSAPQVAQQAVRNILSATTSWQGWASIQDITPLLAEAAPVTFLEAVEQVIATHPEIVTELFKDEGQSLFGECKHAGLLWALESIAWDPQYFERVVALLVDLAKLDPGGQWVNRPLNSLKDLFLPQYPQTHAGPTARLSAFETLIQRDAQLAWQIAYSYFDRGIISASHQYQWRDAGGERRGLEPESNENYAAYLTGLWPKAKALAAMPINVIQALDDFTRLPPDFREQVASVLLSMNAEELSLDDRLRLLEKVREALNWINSYGKEEYQESIPKLKEILQRFEPDDVIERVGWLLKSPWPRLPEGTTKDYDADEEHVAALQQQAARELLDSIDIEAILSFAKTTEYTGVVGTAIGRAIKDDEEDQRVLSQLIKGALPTQAREVTGYAAQRIRIAGIHWIDRQIAYLKTVGVATPEVIALMLLGLPEQASTWEKVAAFGIEVEKAYWGLATGRSRSDRLSDAALAVTKLLNAHRPDAALEIAGDPKLSLPSALLKRLLLELLEHSKSATQPRHDAMLPFHLGYVFRQIHERDELPLGEIVALEWPYASLFDDFKQYLSKPLAIHRLLQRDPGQFADFVALMYKRDDRIRTDEEPLDQKAMQIARNAREVVSSWRLMPGLSSDGGIDEGELRAWVLAVRDKCRSLKTVTGCDIELGTMLAHAPRDSDGNWPHTAVRNIIELLANQTIDRHIETELFNSRGTTVRSPGEGGRLERELALTYRRMSDALKEKWPRTAQILRSMASTYEHQAGREDIDAQLNDFS
ncbi:MAG: hypothetical protein HZC01_03555 [Candidatus Kerfeldbacteria bacterium]|nr:hypothetical protein [Candidatus Kerfeldbacteria bacterium]